MLPETKLREYVGPAVVQSAAKLDVGRTSEPVRSGIGYHILHLVAREPAKTPSIEEFAPQIRAEWHRRAGDTALRDYLDDLRSRADLVVRPAPDKP